MLGDNVFSSLSYYTRTDIELIIQHLCRSDYFAISIVCLLFFCTSVCMSAV